MAPGPKTRTDDIERDLAGLAASLEGLVKALSATVPSENEVWGIYAGAERDAAKLKLRLGVERPGQFQEIPTSKKPEELLSLALERMNEAIRELNERRPLEGLDSLRGSRNYLRGYLAEKRKVRMRERRQAAAVRRCAAKPH